MIKEKPNNQIKVEEAVQTLTECLLTKEKSNNKGKQVIGEKENEKSEKITIQFENIEEGVGK